MATVRLLAALFALLAWPAAAYAQSGETTELQVKAAFLYKFGGYIEWPAGAFGRADSPLSIGVLGADDLADELVQVSAGRSVGGRAGEVRKLKRGSPLAGIHVLFVGRGDEARLAELLGPMKGQPILVVTDSEEALARGSMINFVMVDDKVRFDVATAPAERGNLKISARLLAVARKVIAGPT